MKTNVSSCYYYLGVLLLRCYEVADLGNIQGFAEEKDLDDSHSLLLLSY